mgnify:CR=1 FL=1
MVKTQLIFFDDVVQSGKFGTLRGLCALLIILPFMIPVAVWSNASRCHKMWTVLLASLALCSAIGVQLSGSYIESIVYASLIGLVISSVFICIKVLMFGYEEVKNKHLMWISIPYLIVCLICAALFTHWMSTTCGLYGSWSHK